MKLRLADNSSRTVMRVHQRDAGNVSRQWKTLHIRLADNSSRIGFDSATAGGGDLTATPDYLTVSGAADSHAGVAIQTNTVTVTVTGGKAPYDVEWTADFGGWTISAPTGSDPASPADFATYFLSPTVNPGDSDDNNFTLTVTDDRGDTAMCVVAANVYNFGT